MKKFVFCSIFALMGVFTFAQSEENFTAGNEGWLVDLNKAYELSQKEGKPVMANFTGSDWCGWCKKLTRDVFSKSKFQEWAEENVILLELDFPRRKQIPAKYRQQNANLQQAFNVRGFPTIWVFNMEKDSGTGQFNIKALGKTGYKSSVDAFIGEVDKLISQNANP